MSPEYQKWSREGIIDVWPLKCRVRLNTEAEWGRFCTFMVQCRDMGELDSLTPVKLAAMGFQVLSEIGKAP